MKTPGQTEVEINTLSVLPNRATATLLRALATCIERFGRPQCLRTDNEGAFQSWAFRLALRCAGIQHQRIEPLCPWQNGRIERFFGSLKQKLDRWEVPDLDCLQVSLAHFRLWYNHIQHLQGLTPAEAWAGVNIGRHPPKNETWFDAWDGLLTGYYLRR